MAARRHGTVWIAEDVHALDQPAFWGYWDAEPDAPPAMLEEMPNTGDLDEAIAWGRARAEVVLVRVTLREDYFSAGDRPPASGSLETWPPPPETLATIERERRDLTARARRLLRG